MSLAFTKSKAASRKWAPLGSLPGMLFDERDRKLIESNRFHLVEGYAAFYARGEDGKKRHALLHRYLTNAPKGTEVDHRNGNRLDNRRDNLRVGTKAENRQNVLGVRSHSKSGVRGVRWHKQSRQWTARLTRDGKRYSLGYFNSIEEAGRAVQERLASWV